MSELNHEAIADTLDAIAEQHAKLASYFRNGGSDKAGGSVNGTAKKPAAKSTAKPAAGKTKAKAEPEDAELTIDEVRDALKELMEARGKEVMVAALESVGAGKLADVDESQYQELITEIERLKEEEPEEEEAPAKKTRTRSKAKPKGPTADDLLEKFKELIEADRDAAKKVLKTMKVAKISEIDDDDDIATAMDLVAKAMPSDDDGDDDLL